MIGFTASVVVPLIPSLPSTCVAGLGVWSASSCATRAWISASCAACMLVTGEMRLRGDKREGREGGKKEKGRDEGVVAYCGTRAETP